MAFIRASLDSTTVATWASMVWWTLAMAQTTSSS
jgi:hypothetical protein